MPMKRLAPLAEVALVLILFLVIREALKDAEFGDWQVSLFGRALFSSGLLFFVLPLTVVLISGRSPGSCGLTTENLRYHSRAALRAMAFVMPATMLFPVIAFLGTNPREWLGASILTVGFAVGGLLFAKNSRDLTRPAHSNLSWNGLSVYIVIFVVSLTAIYLLQPLSPLAARLVSVLIFVGFLEEFFSVATFSRCPGNAARRNLDTGSFVRSRLSG